jgi:hypothetical protein
MARVRKRMHAAVTTGTAETSRPSPRDGLTVAPRSPRGPAVLPPSPACSSKHANLASAPGCQDHTAWPSAKAHRTRRNDRLNLRPPKPRRTCRPMSLVWQHRRGHRCPPHVRDDRDTPLRSRRDGRIKPRFLEKRKRNFAAGRSGTGDVLDRAHENSFCAPKIAPVVHRQTNRPMRRPDASAWIRLSSRSFISVSVSIDNCSREPPSNLFSVASGAAGQPCLSMRRRTRRHGIVHLKRLDSDVDCANGTLGVRTTQSVF